MRFVLFAALALITSSVGGRAQTAPAAPPARTTETTTVQKVVTPPLPAGETAPIITHHAATVGGKRLVYTVTTGLMPLKSEAGEIEANIFYMAYTLDNPAPGTKRPLMFSFNGGPGSASVWLHLGAIGPKRVQMRPEGGLPPPPYNLVDNDATWLDQTDLVFIDPVGTGYSRPVKPENGPRYWSVSGDVASVGEFIRLYLTRNERWTAPLFLVGESYGTTRAAGLSNWLADKGIALNGIVLVSSILNFQTADVARGNDLPYILYLPTYTATAFYHKKLPTDLQRDLTKTLAEAEKWASGEYTVALGKGDALTSKERQETLNQLARYTGLSKAYLESVNLRVEISHFCKELLRSEKRSVGRLDSRFQGIDESPASETPDEDPSELAIRPPFTSLFNQYVRADLGYQSDQEYYILGGGIKTPWDLETRGGGYLDVSNGLRAAFTKNPYMRVFVASGYFDLATPYFATRYTLNHMGLDPSLRDHVTGGYYQAGHMMYIDTRSLSRLRTDVGAFLQSAIAPASNPALPNQPTP